jgi:hypothetical protein
LKKRSKKLLSLRHAHVTGHGLDLPTGPKDKSFLLLFFKKEVLSSLAFSGPHRSPPYESE